jgi:hypothetical protein
MDEQPIHETATEARAGSTPHIVRYVLIISLVLVVAGMGAALIFGWSLTN